MWRIIVAMSTVPLLVGPIIRCIVRRYESGM